MILSGNISEKYQVEKNIFYFDDNILFILTEGDCDKKTALKVNDLMMKIFESRNNLPILVDMNKAGKSTPEARKIWKELMNNDHTSKIAFVGIHMVARVIAEFLMLFSGNKKSRFFHNQEGALEWLKNDTL
jgi:hypothetical protein